MLGVLIGLAICFGLTYFLSKAECWPISDWISLGELLEQDNLVEVYTR